MDDLNKIRIMKRTRMRKESESFREALGARSVDGKDDSKQRGGDCRTSLDQI